MEASSSAEMDDSVAALFEEPRPPSSLQSSLDRPGQSSEELNQRLLKDLETTRAQAKLYECELFHIKDLLKSAWQERDEAREEVWKLKEGFFSASAAAWVSNNGGAVTSAPALQPANSGAGGDYSLHIQHSSKASSSPGQHMQLDCISSSIHNLHWDLHDLPALRPVFPDVQSNNLSPLLCGGRPSKGATAAAFAAVVPMDMDQLSDQHNMQQQESAIFSEANELLEQEVQAGQEESNAQDEFGLDDRLLRRQAASMVEHWAGGGIMGVDMQHQMPLRRDQELLLKPDEYQGVMQYNQSNEQSLNFAEHLHSQAGGRLNPVLSQRNPFKDMVGLAELPSEVNDLHEFLSCTDAGAGRDQLSAQAAASISPNLDVGLSMELPWQASDHGSDMHVSNPCTPTQGNTALYAAPKHLPEPPESDPEVMLRSLPERGKLLQAVMQAGPLLHSLLLAGSLPRWRRPPPPKPVDPMESSLMMQCCNNAGKASMKYSTMHNSHLSPFPSLSFSTGEGGASSNADHRSTSHVFMNVSSASASASAATWTMARMRTLNEMLPSLPLSSTLSSAPTPMSMASSRTWMTAAEMSMPITRPEATTTTRVGASATRSTMTMPKEEYDHDELAGGLKSEIRAAAGGDMQSSWMSTLMDQPLGSYYNKSKASSSTRPMLNTSTNLSYSNRLLRSSALLPKRLVFNNKRRH